jgi:LysR family glycine cleavage system transcriptional activator
MRYRRITAALDAIDADAGVALCGVALIAERLASGTACLPYPDLPGHRSGHAFIARYRASARATRQIDHFRKWLCEQAAETARTLELLELGGVSPLAPRFM